MITVHHLNNSRSQRVLWLLEELGEALRAGRKDYMEAELAAQSWFAGEEFTAADVQMSFPLEAAASRGLECRAAAADGFPRAHSRAPSLPACAGTRRSLFLLDVLNVGPGG
jgi:glutathione S-transferase